MKSTSVLYRLVPASLMALGLAACMDTYASRDEPMYRYSTAAPAPPPELPSGHVTDAKGRALYMFVQDQGGPSKCYGKCAAVWPPLLAGGPPVAEPVDKKLLGQAPRRGEPAQVTLNGMPLYYYVKDQAPGETKGQGVRDEFGTWYLVSPDGKVISGG